MDRKKSYAKRKKTRRRSASGGLWLFTILLVILFIAGLFYLKSQHGPANKQPKTPVTKNPTRAIKKPLTPKFDFYTILQDAETTPVTPRKQPSSPPTTAPTNAEANTKMAHSTNAPSVGKQAYILQVGSFKNSDDADRLRGKLILQGFQVNIGKTNIAKTTWHRVQIGPFASKKLAIEAKTQLKSQNMDSLLLQKS